MILENPQYLWLLLGLLVLVPLFVLEYYRTRQALISLGGRWEDPTLQGTVFVKQGLSGFMFCLFYVSVVLGLCGISWGEHPVEEDRKGLDVVFSLDVSLSMLAQDMGNSSRLDRSREFIRSTMEDLPGSRTALVVFRGGSVLLMPLTEDIQALGNALPQAGPMVLTNPGTSIPAGLKDALEAFPKGGNRHRVVVLLTDGENLQDSWADTVPEIRQKGILLVVVGMGSAEGATIRLEGNRLVTDRNGAVVKSRKNAQVLADLASAAGGVYLDGLAPGIYARIVGEIQEFQSRHEREGFRLDPVRREPVFVALALVFLALYVVIRSVRWRGVW